MNPIPAWVRRLWDAWDLRVLVLLSLILQIILSLFGNRRKSISALWINILLWTAYLLADWIATVALGKLSDANNGNTLGAIWAPLLLLHLGGPDTITAYSLEDTHLWMRHLSGLVFQFSVAVYVILMRWEHSWFSFMSIPALVAGFIKYGERTWVLFSVSHDESGEIIPFGDVRIGSNLGDDYTLEDNNYVPTLCVAHRCVKAFKKFTQFYDLENDTLDINRNWNEMDVVGDISLLWNAVEVEMGLMFDLLYTKAPINFSKRGLILRCLTFSCTVAVLIVLVLQLISTGEGGEKWQKVDIVITGVLLVGALALEIYAIVSLYLFSDWAMLWLLKNNKGKQLIQFRRKISWLFSLPRQYRCETVGQFDVIDYWVKRRTWVIEPDQKVGRRIINRLLLGIKREDMLMKCALKSAVIVPSLLFKEIIYCALCLSARSDEHRWIDPEENAFWKIIFEMKILEQQIFLLYMTTEVCYNLETEWDTPLHVASRPRYSSGSLEENRELCRTLSRYMMYLVLMRSSLLPMAASSNKFLNEIWSAERIGDARDVVAACRNLEHLLHDVQLMEPIKSQQKDERWETLKLTWVRILCYAATKGQTNEHLRGLSQGGEFLTFLWFFLPLSIVIELPEQW